MCLLDVRSSKIKTDGYPLDLARGSSWLTDENSLGGVWSRSRGASWITMEVKNQKQHPAMGHADLEKKELVLRKFMSWRGFQNVKSVCMMMRGSQCFPYIVNVCYISPKPLLQLSKNDRTWYQ